MILRFLIISVFFASALAGAVPVMAFEGGGGPGPQQVNVNSPKIGDCGAPDSNGRYKVSTCKDNEFRQWTDLMRRNYVASLMSMAEQFSAVMLHQMEILGGFFDAKEILEGQRDFSVLAARAHKDYHPSETMCRFGTGVRSLANAEERGRFNKRVAETPLLNHYKNTQYSSASSGFHQDLKSRIEKFKQVYCDPRDHDNQLWQYCFGLEYSEQNPPQLDKTDEQRNRMNKDVDYNATFYNPLTLDVNFTDQTSTPAEEDLVAMARHLYWDRAMDPADQANPNTQNYQRARAMMSKMSLAHNSFMNIVGMKSQSPVAATDQLNQNRGSDHLLAILREFGLTEQQITDLYGNNPSYYAQMEILTKKIYQHPQFYTNLYDKPANVDRINTTLEAIKLMQLRDRYDSQVRREMLMAALLEDALRPEHSQVESKIVGLKR